MSGPILVINPNSNAEVTAGLDRALAPFRLGGGPEIECLTLAEGPFGVESRRDGDAVILPMLALLRSRSDAAAVVVACYSDPGVETLREQLAIPVFGIQEAGVLAALGRADRFGVIALSEASIARHRRHLRGLGLLDRWVGEEAVALSVAESAHALATLEEAGRRLSARGAGALVLGCTGMAEARGPLAAALGVPVIEPTQAAVALALHAVLAA